MDVPEELVRKYPVYLNQIGPDGKMRPYVVFDLFQDIAAEHAELLGVGMSRLKDLGIIWVLSRMKVQMTRYPVSGEVCRVRTWPSGFQKLFATRQYELYSDMTNELLGTGTSFWLTLDYHTLRPMNPASTVNGLLPDNKDKPFYFPSLGKIAPVEPLNPVFHRAEQSNIDFNDHVNNAYYTMFAQDWLAREAGKRIFFKEFQINYNHAVKFGEDFCCGGRLNGDGSFAVTGMMSNGVCVFSSEGICTTASSNPADETDCFDRPL